MRYAPTSHSAGARGGLGTVTRFAVVGAVTTALDFVLFTALVAVGAMPALANLFSYSCGILVSYLLHRSWTFGARGSPVLALKFVVSTLAGLMISTCLVALFVMIMPALIAKILSVPLVFIWNYLMARLWVFRT
ncbi:GtrA family protein [Ensifer sp. IC3342]|nr:GtrA family protein [Ensifer sp. BRP08]MCA1448561.1 GtrA family protein [Ensifer sp. IC3342]